MKQRKTNAIFFLFLYLLFRRAVFFKGGGGGVKRYDWGNFHEKESVGNETRVVEKALCNFSLKFFQVDK